MSMGRLRRYRSSHVASLLLLLVLWGSPHKQQDDAACLPQLTSEQDASKHALASLDSTHRDHCAICHWVRGLKPSFTASFSGAVQLGHASDVATGRAVAHHAPCEARLPARAPPANLL